MKLHYSTQTAVNHRYRKIKAVINALKIQLEQLPHETTTDLTTISPFNSLPLLQTPQGTFFSSNTIIRFLANSQNQLYGGQNTHNQSLIDQWLDVLTCDFEAAVSALVVARDGKQVETALVAEDIHKFLKVVEAHLNGKKFLVGDQLSIADLAFAPALNVVLTTLFGQQQRKAYPNIVAWYLALVATDGTIGTKDLPKDAHKAFKAKPKKENKKDEKKQEKKEEKKEEKKVDEDDLFGDDEEPAKQAPKPKPQAAKPKKEKPAAKSMIVFDVKVHEMETDLLALFEKIKTEIIIDGLVWNNEPKILPIAYGMNKLQIGCVVEDAKVSVDDVYEKIESWEDLVQSIDTVSFQKL